MSLSYRMVTWSKDLSVFGAAVLVLIVMNLVQSLFRITDYMHKKGNTVQFLDHST